MLSILLSALQYTEQGDKTVYCYGQFYQVFKLLLLLLLLRIVSGYARCC